MTGPLLLLLAQVAASSTSDVVVVGHRAEKELAACLARNCPPAQEVEASLQASVEQFADGRYPDARRTLQRAIDRNKRHAAELPGPVSSLYATLATVAEHEGDAQLWKTASRNNLLTLREQLGATNVATMREELQFADDMVGQNMVVLADDTYAKIQHRAAAHGHPDLGASAAFRRAWLALARDRSRDALRFADEAVTLAGPANNLMAQLREIVRTRVAIRKGDDGAVDALAARVRQTSDAPPVLLYAPPVEDINPPRAIVTLMQNDRAIRYADIGYWIRPDGRIADAEVLRTNGLGQWSPVLLRQVRARRYVPPRLTDGQPGLYRIDRFTVRATIGTPIGTRITQRTGRLSVHVIDLTETDAMSEAHRAHVAKGIPIAMRTTAR
ncbi:hypothetical protein F4693_002299 [Sphingomonas endophytica]|uniref:TonB C-terminal domain-containing protein n=1 Tax=Sphingomonas endophytica TaxID=869719 RepID=A0A7X0JCY4_9SPHN|nr:hypothetical protein [Sphingomonas endophytica]MBB6505311.1 hypothetical protein [Sphingomonas endophytica]